MRDRQIDRENERLIEGESQIDKGRERERENEREYKMNLPTVVCQKSN